MLILGIMMGLTLRSKALGAAIIITLLYICVYFWKKKLNLKMLIGCIPVLLIVGAYQIYYYFFSSLQNESARYQLTIKSIEIAADHFPLGSGFGTFASYISAEWYSPIYEMYGLSHVWGLEQGGRPTSELPSHLMNHSVKKEVTNGAHRVILHSHITNLIALTFVLPLEDEVFTRELWEMATECPVVFPDGVGVVGWMVPGGHDIAVATSELMKKYDVAVWAHHGAFCSGPDFDTTFGLMHTVEKSAEILVKVLSMGGKRQTITTQNFRDLAKDFHVTLPERFLK